MATQNTSPESRRRVRYHLRFQILPGPHVEGDARVLVKFCQEHRIEEVVLFFAAEEWNNGLLSAREERRWFSTLKRIKPIFDAAGIVASLNPWPTVLHGDRGRRLPLDRRMKPMVSPTGEVSKACASFAAPAWQRYFWNLFSHFATLGFRVIWVEDDFRYHNHAPLTWGGGFEPEMLARFAAKIGCQATREEVVRNILKSGKPHPWRAKWMATWRECQLDAASGLARAVAAKSPVPTKIGLMSSNPEVHSVEGRDWQRLFAAFSIDGQVAHRPHYAAYADAPAQTLTRSLMMLDLQRHFRPAACEVAPEVENFPFTHWSKSDTQTWAEMALCMFYGSDALLLDLFPFSGNRADEYPRIGAMLDRSRPTLQWIAAHCPKALQPQGVGVPWKQDAQAHVRTTKGESLGELNASSYGPAQWLLRYGVPVAADGGPVKALFGNLAWAFSDEEIRAMLAAGLLLDGVSAEVLCRRGFGPELGIDLLGWLERERSPYTVERVTRTIGGVAAGHCFNANLHDRLAVLTPRGKASAWSEILTPEGSPAPVPA